ncbi:unnamed protein product [Auanema sp. JU1783]|nr:unnamed protein product [Auanema sp. JU1783]
MAERAAESVPLTEKEDRAQNKDAKIEALQVEEPVPIDANNLVYFIVLFHGIGTLLPWNAFMNIAPDYFINYKFQEWNGNVSTPTSISNNFMHYQLIAAQIPNLLFNFVNIFAASYFRMDILKTVCGSLSVVASMLVITMFYIYQNTWDYMVLFFWITIITIVVLNAANGLYQNCIFGVASELPFKYTNAVIIGNNICGTFVTIISILATNLSSDVQFNATAFFGIALLSLVICFISIFFLRKQAFYRFYSEKAEETRQAEARLKGPPGLDDYVSAFKQGYPQFINVFLVFFVTLTIFPGMMLNITPNGKGEEYDFFLPKHLFQPITTFLLFNVFAFFGSLLAGWKQAPAPGKLWIPVFARLLLIPFYLFSNYYVNERTLPVFFGNVYLYILVSIVMSVSNGYYSGMAMMYANTTVDESKQRLAGCMAAFFLILGIFSGVLFSLFISSCVA